MKTALITGITGQDGSYLAEFLLAQGYAVHGIVRRATTEDAAKMANLAACKERVDLHVGSLDNYQFLRKTIEQAGPTECYHFASPSFVNYSLDDEISTFNESFCATHALVSALSECTPGCRLYYAGSSEMFGQTVASPQNEDTPLNPRSIYGIAKVAGYHLVRNYRDNQGFFVATGFLYNHESPRRRPEFVTRKITSTVARIKLGLEKTLTLGALDAERDWGYAPEYVQAAWRMLQQDRPGDYVIATGATHTVRTFLTHAFGHVGLRYEDHVRFDPRFFRPPEKVVLCGNTAKAVRLLDWHPCKPLAEIAAEMVEHDLSLVRR